MPAPRFKQGDLVRKGLGRYVYRIESIQGDLAHMREMTTGRIDCAYVDRLRRYQRKQR